ncbi:type IV pilus twitching motility protein PilT [Patescibacteria group bacterium]|nr:type IV pilus twitching motility protein PilT [Patescibacteria group bacterium]
MAIDLKQTMQAVIEAGSPDLHLQVGQPPVIRLRNGDLSALANTEPVTKEDVDAVINEITNEDQKKTFDDNHQVDFSYQIEGLSRFRVNVFEERNGPSIAFRIISEVIPTIEELELPEIVKTLAMQPHGLVLITGQTGMGKSTTLASVVDYINANRKSHIITIEDPIEFVYKNKQSLVTQREVNVHTHSFADAIRGALRQDPDVVMVGEMRDLETIAAAITLAETGHLVLSTLHTSDAAQTIDRIIDVFPPYQQQQIRAQLSVALKGVISQVLVPRADNEGRVAAREVMIVNDAVRNCISKGESHQIYSIMQINASEGMVLMDSALERLYKNGIITAEEALSKASDLESLQERLQLQIA